MAPTYGAARHFNRETVHELWGRPGGVVLSPLRTVRAGAPLAVAPAGRVAASPTAFRDAWLADAAAAHRATRAGDTTLHSGPTQALSGAVTLVPVFDLSAVSGVFGPRRPSAVRPQRH